MSGEEASAGDKQNFAGKYVLVRNENFDDFLAANGMVLHYCCSLLGSVLRLQTHGMTGEGK